MWRCPIEDEGEEKDRYQRNVARDRSPANHWREGPGCAADHDVLWGRALQDQRIDEHIESDGTERDERSHNRCCERQEDEARNAEGARKEQRRTHADPPSHEWACRGARHLRINIGINDAVEHVGARGAQCATHERCSNQCQRWNPAGSEQHRWNRGDQQQLNDAGFCQRDIGGDCFAAGLRRALRPAS